MRAINSDLLLTFAFLSRPQIGGSALEWVRASAPTGCSPRDSGRFHAICSDLLSNFDLFSFLTDSSFNAQAAAEEKRKVFKTLLESYAASLRLLASAQLQVNQQTAKVAELTGNSADSRLIDFISRF